MEQDPNIPVTGARDAAFRHYGRGFPGGKPTYNMRLQEKDAMDAETIRKQMVKLNKITDSISACKVRLSSNQKEWDQRNKQLKTEKAASLVIDLISVPHVDWDGAAALEKGIALIDPCDVQVVNAAPAVKERLQKIPGVAAKLYQAQKSALTAVSFPNGKDLEPDSPLLHTQGWENSGVVPESDSTTPTSVKV